jgi:hypothetical protein
MMADVASRMDALLTAEKVSKETALSLVVVKLVVKPSINISGLVLRQTEKGVITLRLFGGEGGI